LTDIFEEVEDGHRREEALKLWKRVAPFVWIAAIGLVGSVAWYEFSKVQAAEKQSQQIQVLEAALAALEEGDYATAQAGLRDLASTDAEVAPLAQHLLADTLYTGGGDAAAAADALRTVSDGEDPLGKLAILKAAYLSADTMTLDELELALEGLDQEDGPLGVLALELVAAKAFSEGDVQRAREEFSYLRLAANAPQGVVQRAELALSVLPVVPDEAAVLADDLPPTDAATDAVENTDGNAVEAAGEVEEAGQ